MGMWLMSMGLGASAAVPCATQARLAEAPPLRRPAPSASPPADRALRDPFGVPNVATSEHFAVWSGNFGGVTDAEVEALLAAFELAWDVQIEALAHPAPPTTDQFRFNVYVGDTANYAPDGYGAAGYYTVDPEGYPMVVVAAATLNDAAFAEHTALHEFYHAVQDGLDRYSFDEQGPAAWFFEATAEWAAVESAPDNPHNGPFVFAYLLLPELALTTFDFADSGQLVEYYAYGAFLFPHDVGRRFGPAVIRDVWTDPGDDPDPLEVLRTGLAAEGADLDEVWLDHLAHNAAYDYDAGELYRANVAQWASAYPDAAEIAATATGSGATGRVSGGEAPQRYGAVTFALHDADAGTLSVRVAGDGRGTRGSPARYGARVVRLHDGLPEYVSVPFDGVDGALDVPDVVEGETVLLTIGAWTPAWQASRWDTERFPLDWALEVQPEPGPSGRPEPTPAGCGCGGGGAVGAHAPIVIAAIGLVRRRRRWR